jgi:hypothetical protein
MTDSSGSQEQVSIGGPAAYNLSNPRDQRVTGLHPVYATYDADVLLRIVSAVATPWDERDRTPIRLWVNRSQVPLAGKHYIIKCRLVDYMVLPMRLGDMWEPAAWARHIGEHAAEMFNDSELPTRRSRNTICSNDGWEWCVNDAIVLKFDRVIKVTVTGESDHEVSDEETSDEEEEEEDTSSEKVEAASVTDEASAAIASAAR